MSPIMRVCACWMVWCSLVFSAGPKLRPPRTLLPELAIFCLAARPALGPGLKIRWPIEKKMPGGLSRQKRVGWHGIKTGWPCSQGQWTDATAADVERMDKLGLNTSADLTNRLAVSSDATLLTHNTTGGHQLKINKDQPGDTGSLLFQTGWLVAPKWASPGQITSKSKSVQMAAIFIKP